MDGHSRWTVIRDGRSFEMDRIEKGCKGGLWKGEGVKRGGAALLGQRLEEGSRLRMDEVVSPATSSPGHPLAWSNRSNHLPSVTLQTPFLDPPRV